MVSFEEQSQHLCRGTKEIFEKLSQYLDQNFDLCISQVQVIVTPSSSVVTYEHVPFLLICAYNFSTKDFFSPLAALVEFVIATTNLINGNTFLKSLMEPLGPDLALPRQ
jgi:hypothetical protein